MIEEKRKEIEKMVNNLLILADIQDEKVTDVVIFAKRLGFKIIQVYGNVDFKSFLIVSSKCIGTLGDKIIGVNINLGYEIKKYHIAFEIGKFLIDKKHICPYFNITK